MKEPFELEWLGGPAEHHFRRARPEVRDVPWGTLVPSRYPPALLAIARSFWTDLAVNEYRAIAAFSEVVRALCEAKAPLDLIGMAGGFLAEEALHVELASKVAMEPGGAAPRAIDMDTFALRADRTRTPLERANDLVLRVACVSEAFAGGYGAANYRVSAHPLTRTVYEIILADEARHRRFGTLYLEWASEVMSDAERARLGHVTADALRVFTSFWRRTPEPVVDGVTARGFCVREMHELGWLESERSVPLARAIVEKDVLAPLARFGIALDDEERRTLGLTRLI